MLNIFAVYAYCDFSESFSYLKKTNPVQVDPVYFFVLKFRKQVLSCCEHAVLMVSRSMDLPFICSFLPQMIFRARRCFPGLWQVQWVFVPRLTEPALVTRSAQVSVVVWLIRQRLTFLISPFKKIRHLKYSSSSCPMGGLHGHFRVASKVPSWTWWANMFWRLSFVNLLPGDTSTPWWKAFSAWGPWRAESRCHVSLCALQLLGAVSSSSQWGTLF